MPVYDQGPHTLSLRKIRDLPYNERMRLIFVNGGDIESEIIRLIKDYPDWDHEELEKEIAEKFPIDWFIRNDKLFNSRLINQSRLIYFCFDKRINEMNVYDIFILMSKFNSYNETNYITLIFDIIISEIGNRHSHTGMYVSHILEMFLDPNWNKAIDWHKLVNTTTHNLNNDYIYSFAHKLKAYIKDPVLLKDLQNSLNIYDILV